MPLGRWQDLVRSDVGLRELARATVAAQLARFRRGHGRLVVPPAAHVFRPLEGQHFHPRPELLLQVAGVSRMALAEGQLLTRRGEIQLTPRGVTHHEVADRRGGPFCNLIFMFDDRGFVYHAAIAPDPAAELHVACRARADVPHGGRLYGYLNEAAAYVADGHATDSPLVQGLVLAHLALLRDALAATARPEPAQSHLVTQCQQLVSQNLANPALTVAWLARSIQCSADYLSNLFHRQTGQTLNTHINHERLDLAQHLLRDSTLSVKEIAQRCGFRDAGYFTRRFRRLTGHTPRGYRGAVPA